VIEVTSVTQRQLQDLYSLGSMREGMSGPKRQHHHHRRHHTNKRQAAVAITSAQPGETRTPLGTPVQPSVSPYRQWCVWGVWDNYGVSSPTTYRPCGDRASSYDITKKTCTNDALDMHIKTHAPPIISDGSPSDEFATWRLHIPVWTKNNEPLCYTSPVTKTLRKLRASRDVFTSRDPAKTSSPPPLYSACPWVVRARAQRSKQRRVAAVHRAEAVLQTPVSQHPSQLHLRHKPLSVACGPPCRTNRIHVVKHRNGRGSEEEGNPPYLSGKTPTVSQPWMLGACSTEQLERWLIGHYEQNREDMKFGSRRSTSELELVVMWFGVGWNCTEPTVPTSLRPVCACPSATVMM
jgi:hypothetical protein